MKSFILSNSRKGNVLGDSTTSDHITREASLKRPMDKHIAYDQYLVIQPSSTDNEPMMSPSYLLSPLETILESLDDYDLQYIPLHDIIEAYSVFSLRIRSQMQAIIDTEQSSPALALFKEHVTPLARALKRDIRRLIVDPLYQHQQSMSSISFNETRSIEGLMTDHDIQRAQDLSTLSHYGLRVLSDIFTHETLYSIFSAWDIQDLFADLLKIALTTTLPTPNAEKTWSLVFWTIQVQNLPVDILSIKRVDTIAALRRALNGERGFQAKLDSLKAVHMLMRSQPELFCTAISDFLPAVLANIVADDMECRRQAANALCGITLAKLHMLASPDFPHETTSKDIHTFIKAHTLISEPSQAELCLPHFISQAFSSLRSKEPFWAMIVPACMIVLSDYFLFSRHSLKFCVNSVRPALSHGHKDIRLLHASVWRSLIWAFSRLPVDQTWLRPEDPELPHTMIGIRGKAFRLLKQDINSGKGVSLVEALLLSEVDTGATSVGGVSRVLLVLKSMVTETEQSDRHDGVLLLHRLISAVGSSALEPNEGQESDHIVGQISGLFDATLLDAASRTTRDIVRTLAKVEISYVRQLSQEEILQHWDQLVDVWNDALDMSLQEPVVHLSKELLDIWQALLLVKTDLTQEFGHLTASPSFAGQVAAIINRFLVDSAVVAVQARRLMIVKRLWGVMKNVYSHFWLPAESILAAVLRLEFSLDDDTVRGAWSHLCADLISVGIPTLLHVLFIRSEKQEGQEVTRQLWFTLARSWQDPVGKTSWDGLASFLVIPFKAWAMSNAEFELWARTLQNAMSLALSNSVKPIRVVDRIIQRMGPRELDVLVSFPKGVYALLAHIALSGSDDVPSRVFNVINRSLTANYPPCPESLAPCLEILRLISLFLSSVPVILLVQLLDTIQSGVCRWIGDEKAVMLSTEHEQVVQNIYCGTLGILRKLPPSVETLAAIAPFLCSAFGRQTPSAIGPTAFDEYWRATYHGLEEYRLSYPECLKACLLGYSDAYGGSIANGLSLTSESQNTRKSIIPDSQPSHHGPGNSNLVLTGFASLSLISGQHEPSNPAPLYTKLPGSLMQNRSSSSPSTAKQPVNDLSAKGESFAVANNEAHNHAILSHASRKSPSLDINKPSPLPSIGPGSDLTAPFGPSPTKARSLSFNKRPSSAGIDKVNPKRRRTVSELDIMQPLRSAPPNPDGSHPHKRIPDTHGLSSPFAVASQSVSQSTVTRKRKRIIDWLNVAGNPPNFEPQMMESPSSTPSPRIFMRIDSRASTPSEEEYDSWERGMVVEDSSALQQELIDTEEVLVPDSDPSDSENMGHIRSADGRGTLSSPVQAAHSEQGPQRQQQRHRSQTVPSVPQHHHSHRPFREPPEENPTTITRISALERVYTVVTDDASQIPVVDLVRATGLVTRIQTALNDQLARRLTSESADKP